MIIINKNTVPYNIRLKGDVSMLKNDLREWMENNGYKNDYFNVTDTGFSINGMQEVSFNKFDRYEFDLWSFAMIYDNTIIPNFDRIKVELYGDYDLYIYFISESECVARHYRSHYNPKYEDFEDEEYDYSYEQLEELYETLDNLANDVADAIELINNRK